MTAGFANTALSIELDGAAIDPTLGRSASGVLVRQRLSAPSLAELTFAEPPVEAVARLRFGAPLRLSLPGGDELFSGEVTDIEYCSDGAQGRVVRVRAFDRLHRMRKKQRARVAANTTLAQFIADTARELGLGCEGVGGGPAHRLIVQSDQSDFDLVAGLAAAAGLYVYLSGDTIRLISLAGEDDPIDLEVGRHIAKVRAATSAESLRRGARAKAWDVLRTEVLAGSSSRGRQDDIGLDLSAVPAFADLGERFLFNQVAGSAEEAEALAQADLDRSAGREIVVEATADGSATLRPGRKVRIKGLPGLGDAPRTLTEAVHSFTAESGYLTEISTRPPQISQQAARTPVFTFGAVIDVNDPDRLSRVRTRLDLYGGLESDWMPVLIAGAGQDKGLAVLPEPDDRVLIVFPQGDLAYGVVLGGLYGTSKAPGQDDAGVRPFVWRTGNGQTVTLDAANALARIETSGGDVLELGPKGSRLHAAQDLVIEAPGRTLTLRAKAVEFEQG
jgi:phage baseplate assembly protein gpV